MHRIIKFKQTPWLKSYTYTNTDLRQKAKTDFEIDCGKTMENVRKPRYIKFFTTERRRNYLVSEANYHTTKFFLENLLAIKMKKRKYT